MAQFALASVVQSSAADRQTEAQALYEKFSAEFDGQQRYRGQLIEQSLHAQAVNELEELKFRASGRMSQEIKGLDLDGRPMSLSEYRGRVVLLSFWGTWCFPCMKLVPHERDLVKQFRGQPFEIIGCNSDDDIREGSQCRRSEQNDLAVVPQWNGDCESVESTRLSDALSDRSSRRDTKGAWIGSPSPEELVRADCDPGRSSSAERRSRRDAVGRHCTCPRSFVAITCGRSSVHRPDSRGLRRSYLPGG